MLAGIMFDRTYINYGYPMMKQTLTHIELHDNCVINIFYGFRKK